MKLLRLAAALCAVVSIAHARDLGQWTDADPAIAEWFRTLKQPDHPTVSCCGEADAYFADSYKVAPDGTYIAIITDERPDGPLMRSHIPVGTEVPIPANKLKFDKGNPTGHGIVFMGYGSVFCYLPPGGV